MSNKNDILRNLYILRAALSSISLDKDNVTEIERNVHQLGDKTSALRKAMAQYADQLDIYNGKKRVVVKNTDIIRDGRIMYLGMDIYGDEIIHGAHFRGTPEQHSIASTELALSEWIKKYSIIKNFWIDADKIIDESMSLCKKYACNLKNKTELTDLVCQLDTVGFWAVYDFCRGGGIFNSTRYADKIINYMERGDKRKYHIDITNSKQNKKTIKQLANFITTEMMEALEFCKQQISNEISYCSPDDNPTPKELRIELEKQQQGLQATIAEIDKCKFDIERIDAQAKELRAARNIIIDTSVNLYNYMVSKLSGILPVSNWKNLDIIIYFIQEGYADTIKEALQLVLQQHQNDRIVNAIATMEARLTQTINMGIQQLQNTMITGFSLIANQLEQVRLQQIENNNILQQQNSLLTTQTSALASLNEKVDLNRALMQKADTSCEAILRDVSYMRSLIG